jgi:hypothetical protein
MKMKLLKTTPVCPGIKPGAQIEIDDVATARELLRSGTAELLKGEELPDLKRPRVGDTRPDLPAGPVTMKLLQPTAVCPGKLAGDLVRIDDPATALYFRRAGIAQLVEDPPPQTAMKDPPQRNAAKPEGRPRKGNAEPDPDNSAGD